MLSRHAEGLFWMGRYLERAAYITRMLDVASNKQLELSSRSPDDVWHDLLSALYLEQEYAAVHGGDLSIGAINRFLIFDRDNPVSVTSSVMGARTNVMNVRDLVPIELLGAINRLHNRLSTGVLERHVERSPHEIYDTVAGLCRAVTGAIDEAMPRYDGYRFLMLGRLLERAEMTCRMIEVNRTVSGQDVSAWMSALRSVSGFHGFTQAHGPLAPVEAVVEFMLRDTSFPFGVQYCLNRAAELAAEVSGTGSWNSPRTVGRLAADLRYADVPAIDDPELAELLRRLEDGIRLATEELHNDLFQFGGDPQLYSFEAL